MSEEVRRLRVEEHCYRRAYSVGRASRIRLKGKWLEQAGFSPGDRVDVRVNQGKLVITKEAR